SDAKQVEEGLEYLTRARMTLEKTLLRNPEKAEYKRDLADVFNLMGLAEWSRRDYLTSLKHFQEYQNLIQQIIDEQTKGPKPLKTKDMLARSFFNISRIHDEQGNLQACLDALRQAAKGWSELVDIAPSVTNYRAELGRAHMVISLAERQHGQDPEALASVEKALTIFDRLIKDER